MKKNLFKLFSILSYRPKLFTDFVSCECWAAERMSAPHNGYSIVTRWRSSTYTYLGICLKQLAAERVAATIGWWTEWEAEWCTNDIAAIACFEYRARQKCEELKTWVPTLGEDGESISHFSHIEKNRKC